MPAQPPPPAHCPDCETPVTPAQGLCPRCLADLWRPSRPAAATGPTLRLTGPGFTLELAGETVVGRNSTGREVLSRFTEVSRQHVRLTREPAGWFVEDMHSRNGTSLNDVGLTPGRRIRLARGDRLGLANEVELVVDIQP
ncbi:MAG: FHA domain-containing protein [Candidatus Riflebacteria bacterium]|nr:FHA domain-containing protein [Candidatus Riflebacteria bacterium]